MRVTFADHPKLDVIVVPGGDGVVLATADQGQLHSPRHARAKQRHIQYDPAPPYQADV
jgi:NAD kinase